MKIVLTKIEDVCEIINKVEDKIHFGNKTINRERKIYKVKNPIFYKNNLYLKKDDNDKGKISNSIIKNFLFRNKIILYNLDSPFPVKREQKNNQNFWESYLDPSSAWFFALNPIETSKPSKDNDKT